MPPLAIAAVLLMSFLASVNAHAGEDASGDGRVALEWGVKIPMRDGVRLNATVYRPVGAGPLPVIFTLTPYIADSYHDRAWYFSRNGFVFVLVDARGRGSSEGTFTAFAQEANDDSTRFPPRRGDDRKRDRPSRRGSRGGGKMVPGAEVWVYWRVSLV